MRPLSSSLPSLGLVVALAGCGWNHLPHQSSKYFDDLLWDPSSIVATPDGLYALLPHSGGVALLKPSGETVSVDLQDPGRVTSLSASADGSHVLAAVERYRCEPDDPKDLRGVENVSQCPDDALVVESELDPIADGAITARIPVDAQYDRLAWSDDGRFAIAWLDLTDTNVDLHGVVNLNSVVVVDTEAGTATTVSVGFDANRVLFTQAGDKAVVLSQSSVAVVDLTGERPQREVTFALTLDPDQVVVPVGVSLTPDGRYALISVQGAGDLYVLDLEQHAVNLVSLASAPAAMDVDPSADRTVFVYGGAAVAEILDHQYFDLEQVKLDEPATSIVEGTGFSILWRPGGRDVYQLDLATGDVKEFRLQSGAERIVLSPAEDRAVAFTDPAVQGRYGMELLDLSGDQGKTYPYVLEDEGVGAAFSADGSKLLVLQQGVDYLYEVDPYTFDAHDVELPAAPVGIGATSDGQFYVTEDDPLGLVTFLDPTDDSTVDASGFGAFGLAGDIGFLPEETP